MRVESLADGTGQGGLGWGSEHLPACLCPSHTHPRPSCVGGWEDRYVRTQTVAPLDRTESLQQMVTLEAWEKFLSFQGLNLPQDS